MDLSAVIPQMILALLVVFGLLSMLAFVARRMTSRGQSNHNKLKILSSLPIGSKEKLLLVQCGEQELLLGVTQNNIQPLLSAAPEATNKLAVHNGAPNNDELQPVTLKPVAVSSAARNT